MQADWVKTLPAHPGRRDALIAAFWLVVGGVAWGLGFTGIWGQLAVFEAPRWAFLVTLAAAAAPLLMRSRRPLVALGLGAAVALADTLLGASVAVVFVFTDLIYAAVKYGSPRAVRILLRLAGFAAAALAAALVLVTPTHPEIAVALVQWGLIVAVSGLWGWNVRAERASTAAELATRHASDTRELRTRIAHDLHDLVANQIAVAGLHIEAAKLQAAKLDRADPDAGPRADLSALQQSLDRAKNGTDRAHHELRGLISVLTLVDEAGSGAPIDTGEELASIAGLLPAGRAVHWAESADETISRALAREQTARVRILLRSLQELAANAAKHGTGDVEVRAEHLDGVTEQPDGRALRIAVSNARRAGAHPLPTGTGLGIEGTRVLLESVGGTLRSGADGATWRAVLELPTLGARRGGRVPPEGSR